MTASAEGTRRSTDSTTRASTPFAPISGGLGRRRRALSPARRQPRPDVIDPLLITFDVACPATERSGTRVSIEHRGWEALGARGPGQRERNQRGWSSLLPHFKAVAS